jgi:hypothetical protein
MAEFSAIRSHFESSPILNLLSKILEAYKDCDKASSSLIFYRAHLRWIGEL